jgi:TM2 domain-containing membrane protein YozV
VTEIVTFCRAIAILNNSSLRWILPMTPPFNSKGISYLLWLGYVFGIAGIHRIYNKRYTSGAIWLCTWGLFGVGTFLDLFFIPEMVDEHNRKIRQKLGISPDGVVNLQQATVPTFVTLTPQPVVPTALSQDQLMIKLAQVAQHHQGQLTVTRAVIETGANFEQVEKTFLEMVKKGYVLVDNHPETGVVVYHFPEL